MQDKPKTLQSSLIMPLNKGRKSMIGAGPGSFLLNSERSQLKEKKHSRNLINSRFNLQSTALYSINDSRKRSQLLVNRSVMESVNNNTKMIRSSREIATASNQSDDNESPLNSILLNPLKKKKQVGLPQQRSHLSTRLSGKEKELASHLDLGNNSKSIR